MKFKNLPLILLLIIFVILGIFYIMYVCNYNINEFFTDDSTGVIMTYLNTTPSTHDNCFLDVTDYNKCKNEGNPCVYTDKHLLLGNSPIEYHNTYTCENIKSDYTGRLKDIDSKDLLLTYKCVSINPCQLRIWLNDNSIENMFFQDYYNEIYPITSGSTNPNLIHTIRNNIIDYINNNVKCGLSNDDVCINTGVTTSGCMVGSTASSTDKAESKFPIYACISQSPYIKDGNEKTIVWDHNRGQPIEHYKYSCSLGIQNDNTDLCDQNHKMFIQVVLIFFNNNRQNIDKFIQYVDRNKSNSLQCNMNCGNGDRQYGLTCGCLNKNNSYDSGNYNSICKTGNSAKDYSILYYVNPFYEFGTTSLNEFTKELMFNSRPS